MVGIVKVPLAQCELVRFRGKEPSCGILDQYGLGCNGLASLDGVLDYGWKELDLRILGIRQMGPDQKRPPPDEKPEHRRNDDFPSPRL